MMSELVAEYVSELMREEVPAEFCFHSLEHTKEVVNAVQKIGKAEGVIGEELQMLITAAWFHDTGIIEGHKNHEQRSMRIASQYLMEHGFDGKFIEQVTRCIAATQLPQQPAGLLECIICDADLFHLSQPEYWSKNKLLRKEINNRECNYIPDAIWYKKNLEFLRAHHYFTTYGRNMLEPLKKKHITRNAMHLQESTKQKIKLTIIVPVYNEQETLLKFNEEMNKYLNIAHLTTQVLFVNDGSSDGSLQLIKKIANSDSRYQFISLAKNSGLSAALKAGIDHINTPYTGYIDADLQTSPLDFNEYLNFLNHYALVNGVRKKRHDSFIKKLSSKIANKFRRWMINDGIQDTCCPLKIMHTENAKKMPFFKGMHRFIPALIQLQGEQVKEIEVQHFERFAGKAKYNLLNRLTGPFVDTLVFVWFRKRNISYQIVEMSRMDGDDHHLIAETA